MKHLSSLDYLQGGVSGVSRCLSGLPHISSSEDCHLHFMDEKNGSLREVRSCWAWWCTPIIPATWEVGIEGSQSTGGLGKSKTPYLKNKLKTKGLGTWINW
jgi:hypothetical protein